MRLIFAGTPEFSAQHLQALIDSDHQIVGVYTQPDRRAGRGKKMIASPVKILAQQHQLPLFQPASLKDIAAQQQLAALQADVMVVVAYGLLLPKAVLEAPRHGCVNVHASILPRWRGAAPIQRAIAAGDTSSGVTIMQMDVGLDTGPILILSECPISPEDTGGSLQDKLAQLGSPALLQALEQIEAGSIQARPQNDSEACYAAKLSKQEAAIDWHLPASQLHNMIRAFNPFPVAYFQLGDQPVRVWQARATTSGDSGAAPGTILAASAEGIDIACGQGSLRLLQLQFPGKKILPVAEILNGHGQRFQVGSVL